MNGKTTGMTSAIAAIVSLAVAGCGATKIAYNPMPGGAPAPKAAVTLKVVDERPADKGGSEKALVGQVRGSYGIPAGVSDSSPDVATRTVAEATTDALKQAGVGVGSGGSRTLVATVKHYWMDGFTGYKATVTVQYALEDASGKVLWTKDVSGGAGGALVFKSAQSMAQDMFGSALSDLAKKAAEDFKSPEFQKALG
jgi:hypothetical protein